MANKSSESSNEVAATDVTDLVGEVERSQLVQSGGSWFNRGSLPRTADARSRKITELEQQVKILANRPNIFELDDAEVMAIAGEDAALLIRAAKSKATSLLAEGENSSRALREEAAKELEIAKKTAQSITRVAEADANLIKKKLKQDIELLKLEGEKVIEKSKVEAARIAREAELRAKELLTRALKDADDEKNRILIELQAERKRALARIESQRDASQKAAVIAERVHREFANAAVALKGSLDESLAELTQIKQKTEAAEERLARVQDKS